jgi:hypothetical protein
MTGKSESVGFSWDAHSHIRPGFSPQLVSTLWQPQETRLSQPTRAHQSSLIAEHDELGAVSGVELGHDSADMGASGRWAHVQPGSDVVVVQPSSHELEDFSFSVCEHI